jgi:hypothetical protein
MNDEIVGLLHMENNRMLVLDNMYLNNKQLLQLYLVIEVMMMNMEY